jgi:hypothetical protein
MNESLDLRNRINKMRSINNLETNDDKFLNHEKNKSTISIKKEEKKFIDNFQNKAIDIKDRKKIPNINNTSENFKTKKINRKNLFQDHQLNLNKNKNFNSDNEAQFRLLAKKFNESVEVILELSEKVNNLENMIYQQPQNKKSRGFLFFLNFKLIFIMISFFILSYGFSLLPMDTSAINEILNDILSTI